MQGRILDSRPQPSSDAFGRNREANLGTLAEIRALLEQAAAGGGPDKLARHRQRGKLTIRERLALLLDPGSPFLNCSH